MHTRAVSEESLFTAIQAFLVAQEGSEALPYADANGNPSVGIGINLTNGVYAKEFLRLTGIDANSVLGKGLIGVFSKKYAGSTQSQRTAALQAAITKLTNMSNVTLSATQITELFRNITFGTAADGGDATTRTFGDGIKTEFAKVATTMKKSLGDLALLDTSEGMALLSLSFNGTAGDRLWGDLKEGDSGRASAWYEIAYVSNAKKSYGVAKRRYMESAMFGLYNPDDNVSGGGVVPLSEAMNVYASLSEPSLSGPTRFQNAVNYDAQLDDAVNGYNYIDSTGHPTHKEGANDIFASPLLNGTVLDNMVATSLAGALLPAEQVLINHFIVDAAVNPFLGSGAFDPADFSSVDVQVAAKNGGQALKPLTVPATLPRSAPPTLLIAQGGNVTLDGSDNGSSTGAPGQYALIGGSGNSTIYVGDGNDYIVAGTGDALITGGPQDQRIGSGNDTIVLGGSDHMGAGGRHTVWGGAGDDNYYLSLKNSDVIHLGSGTSSINLVDDAQPGVATPVALSATSLSPLLSTPGRTGTYLDKSSNQLLFSSKAADNTTTLRILGLDTFVIEPPAPNIRLAAAAETPPWNDLIEGIVALFAGAGAVVDTLETESIRELFDTYAASDSSASSGTGMLEIDGYDGSNVEGITLDDAPEAPTGSDNLSQLRSESNTLDGYTNYYNDALGSTVTDIFGSDAAPGTGYTISGSGNATYIQTGKGAVNAFLGDIHYTASNPLDIDVQGTIQGNSGSQDLIGVGNGHETIIGGSAGDDTSVWTSIDAGGADAMLIGGGQNSVIWGGTGHDTIVASSIDTTGDQPYNPVTLAVAGLSFYGQHWYSPPSSLMQVTDLPGFSVNAITDPGDFQVQIQVFQSDGTYSAPTNLLGSTYVPAFSDGDSTLPGSVMIGGSGFDMLIGNSGNDTLTGGDPAAPQGGVIDEILLGGAGSDLIYGGSGTEVIFADMSPGAAANWADLDAGHADTIYGGSGNAYIYGSGADNVIHGGTGNYTIYVGNGNSYVETGDGNSIVYGGSGNNFIVAGSGYDSIEAGDGDTYVYGGDGQSTVVAGAGDDTFEAGSGTTTYQAASGRETLLIGGTGGSQRLINASFAAAVDIRFTPDIDPADIVARRDQSGNLKLINQYTGRTLQVDGYFSGSGAGNLTVTFGDGTVWDAASILTNSMRAGIGDDDLWGTSGDDVIVGGLGNDTIRGISGNDVLTGGSGDNAIYGGAGNNTITGGDGTNYLYGGDGNSTLIGGAGSNYIQGASGSSTYVFELGNGSESISPDRFTSGIDVVQFGEGIDPQSVTFAQAHGGSDLIVSFGNISTSTVTITGFFSQANGSGHHIQLFQFDGESTLTATQVTALAAANYASDNGNDNIHGGSGDSHLNGGSGSDTLTGGSGNATIIGGSGNEVITGGTGRNVLVGGSGYDTITAGDNGDNINAGSGIAKVVGGAGDDTLSSEGALATIEASSGLDTYEFGVGSGQLSLGGESSYDTAGKGGVDTLQIAAGLSSADLTFTRIGDSYFSENALVIGIKGSNDYFRIDSYFLNENDIESELLPLQIRFANGEVMSYQDVAAAVAASSGWNGATSDVVPQVPGIDPSGADYFDRGDGSKVLNFRYNLEPQSVQEGAVWEVRLGQGVRQQDISLVARGTDVLLTIKGTNDTLLLPGMLNAEAEGYAATQFTFADGSAWSVQQIIDHTSRGPGVAATVDLTDQESIAFGYGDGQKIVNVTDSSGNTLVFGPGIRSTDITAVRTSHGVEFILKSTGESITLIDMSGRSDVSDDGEGNEGPYFAAYPVEQVRFADGAVWGTRNIYSFIDAGTSVEELESHTPRAPSGVDVITTGQDDNQVFVGSGDSLVVIGDGYNDTTAAIVIHAGADFGNTTIEGSYDRDGEYGLGDSRVVSFAGLDSADLAISRTFDDRAYEEGVARTFSSDGTGLGDLIITSRSTGRRIVVPYRIYRTGGQLSIASSITGISFDDGSSLAIGGLIGMASVSTTGVEGVRGAQTLQAPDGGEIRAAIGNTVLVGSHQRIEADVSNVDSSAVQPSHYIMSTGSTADTIIANIYSTLSFSFNALSSDYAVIWGLNGEEILYRQDNGNFVTMSAQGKFIRDPSGDLTSVDLTIQFADKTLRGPTEYRTALAQSSPLALTDAQGRRGYYIDTINTSGYRMAYVRGAVSNQVFGGLGWSGFDASAADVIYDLRGLHTQIDAGTNAAPVNFTFATGLGDARVFNFDSGRFNIDLAAGVTAANISVFEDESDVQFIITSANGHQDRLEVDNMYAYSPGLQAYYEKQLTLHFADGTSWTNADVHARAYGLAGNNGVMSSEVWIVGSHPGVVDLSGQNSNTYTNVIIKSDGRNTLELGTDMVDAKLGDTTFLVSRNSQAKITGFDSSRDDIGVIDGLTASDVGVKRSAEWDSSNGRYMDAIVLVERKTGRNLLTVSGARLFLDDQAVVSFSDGTSWSFADLARSVPFSMDAGSVGSYLRGGDGDSNLAGSSGNDVIAAGAGAVTIDGAGGADVLYAGAGDDTFIFGAGYGQDTIVGMPGPAHNNVLSLSTGITANDVDVARADDGSNVELRLVGTNDRVTLANFFNPSGDRPIESLHFADGTTWSASDLLEKSYQGGATSKYIAADATHESVAGGAGNDTIIGDEAQDTLAGGAGQNVIRSGGGSNHIQLGSGSDTVYGGDGTDVIVMGSGNAVVYGGAGAEAFVYGAQFGSSTVYAADNAVSNDIQFTDGITAQDVSFAMAPDGSLHVSLDSGNGSIVLPGHAVGSTTETDVHRVNFSDGTAVSMSAIDALLAASGGNPVHASPDIFDAGLPAAYDPANSIHVVGATQVAPSRASHMIGADNTDSEQAPADPAWHPASATSGSSGGVPGKSASSALASSVPGAGQLSMPSDIGLRGDSGQSSFQGHTKGDVGVDGAPHGPDAHRHAGFRSAVPRESAEARSAHGDPGIRIHGRLGWTPIRPGAPRDATDDEAVLSTSRDDAAAGHLVVGPANPGEASGIGVSRHRRAVARTSDAADAMVKALVAQQSQSGELGRNTGELTDRANLAMGALGSHEVGSHAPSHGDASVGLERMIQAMASFAVQPAVSSVSSSALSEADAITLAVNAH